MVSGLRLCFPASFGLESRVGAAQHGRKGGMPRCVTKSFTILVTDALFITGNDVMTSGPRPVRISTHRSPTGFLPRTHTAPVEEHSRHGLPSLSPHPLPRDIPSHGANSASPGSAPRTEFFSDDQQGISQTSFL